MATAPDTSAGDDGGDAASFGLTEDQREFRAMAAQFAQNELAPHSARWDAERHFPVDVLREAASLGLGAITCREEHGGTGLGRLDAAVLFEALAYGDVSFTAYLTIHNMCCSVIDRFGTDAQRAHFLPALSRMDRLASYCLTEPNSGSDAASLATSARRVAGTSDYALTGAKAFISGAGVSDVYLVMARTEGGITCFLVERDAPGLNFGKPEHKLGWNLQPTCAVTMEDVRVPEANVVGTEGQGFKIAMAALDGGRVNIGACSVGGAHFALDQARAYAKDRKQFGKPLEGFQATQFALADMATSLQASRLMVRHAAAALDAGHVGGTGQAAMAKRFATDACFEVANRALQVHGGYGYLRDYPVERVMRDLRVHSILEGTNEIMRVIIARQMQENKI